ncbi:MAG TPA: radical SAM protein, partial [Bacteroidia bacterium]|nr:radical SAM protein [Bacteroidia bacterium]
GDRLVALRTQVPTEDLRENTRTGIGRYVERGWIRLTGVAWVDEAGNPVPVIIEEVMAEALRLGHEHLHPFEALQPRSFSVLPVARGCQAACPFCFSDASASAEQDQARLDLEAVLHHARKAARRGAERFVITGGGEPGLLRHELMCRLIRAGNPLGKAVLITNGHHLARKDGDARTRMMEDYADAGLKVLAVSRHHHDDAASARLMSLETDVAGLARTWHKGRERWPELRFRLTCVLQRGGVDDLESMEEYVAWAASLGVGELCFKELYVSTSVESVYHRHAANAWSHEHQTPLSLVLDFAAKHGFTETARLPWGAPVFLGEWRGTPMRIAAYTEPSLLWERHHGIARSWNLMADGRCLVSLEDRHSEIDLALTA